jgi:hypothetical protein
MWILEEVVDDGGSQARPPLVFCANPDSTPRQNNVGRKEPALIRLENQSVSRLHAQLVTQLVGEKLQFSVVDRSKFGTFVNEQKCDNGVRPSLSHIFPARVLCGSEGKPLSDPQGALRRCREF